MNTTTEDSMNIVRSLIGDGTDRSIFKVPLVYRPEWREVLKKFTEKGIIPIAAINLDNIKIIAPAVIPGNTLYVKAVFIIANHMPSEKEVDEIMRANYICRVTLLSRFL